MINFKTDLCLLKMKEEKIFLNYILKMTNTYFLELEHLTLLTSWFNKTPISDGLVVVEYGFGDGTL